MVHSDQVNAAPANGVPPSTGPAATGRETGVAVAIAVVAILVYWPALRGGLVWDDNAHVTAPALRSWSGLWRIWSEPGATQQYYPVLHSAFWLEHRLWGEAVLGYHLVNLVQHLFAAGLFALVLRRIAVPGALLAAAIFALHPVHVESVAWISEQKNTLSLVFYLGAALAYLRFDAGRRPRDYWLAFACFAAALLTKSFTATLPAALLVVFWWRRRRVAWRHDVWPLAPWFLLGATAGLFTASVERNLIIGAEAAAFDLTWLQRGLLAGRAIWFYLGNLAWPNELSFIHPRWTIDPGAGWQWLPLVLAIALTVGLWRARHCSRAPLAAWLIFAGSLIPVLGFFDIYPFRYSFVADHFQYLPNLGLIALLAAALTVGVKQFSPAVRGVTKGGWVGAMAVLTAWQTPMYRDSETLYRTTLRRNPECWMAHNNLGLILSARGDRPDALLHFRQAVALKADYFDGQNNLGLTLTQSGQPRAALPHLREAVRLSPTIAQARNNLGIALAACGSPHEAVAAFRSALHFMPDSPSVHDNLAKALRLAGLVKEASAADDQAARLREFSRRGKTN